MVVKRKRKKKDPRVGTGKKPKGSGRRLYTDENPKDTVSIKFATIKTLELQFVSKTSTKIVRKKNTNINSW